MNSILAVHRIYRLVFVVLCLTVFGFPVLADSAVLKAFPEAERYDLPSAKTSIDKIQHILRPAQPLDFSRLAEGYRALPEPIRRAIHGIWQTICNLFKKIWSLFIRSRQQRLPQTSWVDWIRVVSLPLILVTIAYFLYHLRRRLRREIKEGTLQKKASEESWQKLWKKAWPQRENNPKEALHGLMTAVIRRLVIEARIPDDPSQTLREIERHLKRQGNKESVLPAFSALRGWYERVYYGHQNLTAGDWETIRQAVSCLLGEVPTP